MKDFEIIIKKYIPIQPVIKLEHKGIVYKEIRPDKKIEKFVYCFWQLKTTHTLKEPFIYRVVSDGCIDIFFDHSQPTHNFIMGFCRKYTVFSIDTTFDYIGIRFLPSAFPMLFDINAKTLSNQSQDLIHILPTFSKWIASEIHAQQSFKDITTLLQLQLGDLINNKKIDIDQRFLNALTLIFKQKGNLDTEKDLHTGISPRQLRRVFNYYLGTTPKAFCNVVRFQYILNAKPSLQNLKENKLYFDVGFFDQAHFIKHFKTFYGVTPSKAFQ